MKKILHIPNYYNPHVGGIEQTCEDIVNSLKGKFEQKIICFKDEKKTSVDVVNDIEVTRVGCEGKIASQSIALDYKKQLNKMFREYNPDIVIFHYPNPFVGHYLLPLLKKNKQIKFILYWHLDITKQKILEKFFEGQNKELLNRANRIVSTSEIYAKNSKWLPKYMDKISIIPSCVSIRNVDKTALDEKIKDILKENEGKKIVFAFGRHVKHKGFNYLIDAAKMLPDYNFVLGGSGKLTNELKQMASNVFNFKFAGRLSNLDLEAYFNASDLFAFPSLTKAEAFGLALAEAEMHGLPSVTFTIPGSGVNFVSVDKLTGLEAPNGDSNALTKNIDILLKNDNLRKEYGENAKKRSLELFSFEAFKKSITELLENI